MFLEISQNPQENICARVSFLIKFIKKRLWHRCFPVNFVKFLRTPSYKEHLWLLLLNLCLPINLLNILIILRRFYINITGSIWLTFTDLKHIYHICQGKHFFCNIVWNIFWQWHGCPTYRFSMSRRRSFWFHFSLNFWKFI